MLAARLRSGDLAARPVRSAGRRTSCSAATTSPTFVRPLLELCDDDFRHRRAVLCALMVSAVGRNRPRPAPGVGRRDAGDRRSRAHRAGRPDAWLALAWRGDFAASVEVCVKASLDSGVRQGTRDMFVGIATLDHFSLTDATDDPHGLIERALEVADRSDVAIHRVTCLLGAAWGLAGDRARSLAAVSCVGPWTTSPTCPP